MKTLRFMCILLSVLILSLGFSRNVNAKDSYSWYCGKSVNNKQPVLPDEFTFINDYSSVWLNTTRKDGEINKVAYLTFDAGYENGNVSTVLDILKEKSVPGAFFILINLIERNPDLVLRMKNEGHFVCNHTAHHKDMTKILDVNAFENELNELNNSYKSLTGEELRKYYRPPEGRFSENNLKFANKLGYKTVFWSFAYADWDNNKQPSAEYAKSMILSKIHNGCILLLHPTSSVNVEILGDVIDQMRKEGYEFETLDDLCSEMAK